MMDEAYAIIMVGGGGKRLWPLSKEEMPKPFLTLGSQQPMIKETVERLLPLFPKEKIRLVLSQKYLALASRILNFPKKNYIIEPEPKDTAAAIGLSSLYLPEGSIMVVLPSDHLISDDEGYRKSIMAGVNFVKKRPNWLIILGITPKRPETSYGYFKSGLKIGEEGDISFYKVKRFIEKPNIRKAKNYIKNPYYYWNSGIFIFKKETIQDCFAKLMPELWNILLKIKKKIGTKEEEEIKKECFSRIKEVSIDYGIMEKAKDVAMIEANFGWDDLGTWTSLERIYPLDKNHNLIRGKHRIFDTHDCIIFSDDEEITTFGVANLVIVQANKKILVCSKEKAKDLKKLWEKF
jgi:mannose-1-phosphate guanylyltransferase